MARKLASALMVALMGVPPSITALGLGELDSDSMLNEPLSARIPLLSVRGDDVASIRASLASPAAFERAGLDRPFYLSRLKFEVKQAGEEHYILISTEEPLKEPFLDFLLEVRWPQGDLQREYTVLLDPPRYSAGKPSSPGRSDRVITAQAWSQNGASTLPHPSTEVAVASERAISEGGSTRYGPVQANQTLWGIANEVRPYAGVTVYQTMQAILLGNPDAFIDGDINAIMKGSVLRVPPGEEIARIDAGEAALQMQEQLARWQRTHLSAAPEAPLAQAGVQATALGQGKDGGAEDAPASATPPAEGRLRVVAARDGVEAQATASLADQALAPTQQNILRLQQQLALAQERNASLKSANTRLQQQTGSLKKELINLESIVNLQLEGDVPLPTTEATVDRMPGSGTAQEGAAVDPQSEAALADPSGMPSSARPETAEGGRIGQGDVKNETASGEAIQSAPITAVNSAAGSGAATGTSGSRGSQPTTAATPSETEAQSSAAAANPQASPATQQEASRSLKARFLAYLPQDSKGLVLLVSSVLLVLLLLWAVRRRLGAAALPRELPPEALGPAMGQALATVKPDGTAPNLGHADAQPPAGRAVDESTPLDEAEAYIAYGHYDQAQELLDRALGEHPDSQELRLKLLEVLAAQGDRSGFEAEAQVLHTQVADESDSHWQRAIELARHIAADHPLFGNAMTLDTGTTAVQPPKGMNTAAAVAAESATTPMPQAMDAEFDLSPGEQLAFDQSGSRGKEDLHPADWRQETAVLEFDLGEIEAFVSQQATENAASASSRGAVDAKDDFGLLDFSLSEDWAAPSENRKGNGRGDDRDALQLSDLSLQSGGLDTEGALAGETDDSVSLDEVGTKLDLARAYLDMGDAIGARSLLNEVVTEGNAAQQGEAQDLLRQVG